MRHLNRLLYLSGLLILAAFAHAQDYLSALGTPTFGVNIPVENGYINVTNGNLHIEIPLATNAQRGALALNERLVYDSRIWQLIYASGYQWQPTNVPNSAGGWRLVKGNESGTVNTLYYTVSGTCGAQKTDPCVRTALFYWTGPDGTVRKFLGPTLDRTINCTANCSGMATAMDASGYHAGYLNGAVGSSNVKTIYDPNGVQVYPSVQDRNGNYWSSDANGNLVDTLGHTPLMVSQSGNQYFYDVLSVGGAYQRYTATMETVNVSTHFNQSAVGEFSGSISVIQSLELPDGSSYSFAYDSGGYGDLQSMTTPQGGVVSYVYLNYLDSYQNENRWVVSHTSGGGTTSYVPSVLTQCTANGYGCQEQVKVTTPSLNDTVYTLTLNQGSWNTQIDEWQGTANSGTKLRTIVPTYDFSHSCPQPVCNGSYLITQSAKTVTLWDAASGPISTQTSTAINTNYGKPSAIKTFDFYPASQQPPSSPTQEVDFVYGETVNGAGLPTSITTKDGSGNQVSKTTYNYDEGSVTPSGAPHLNPISGTRGNQTSSHQWINTTGATFDQSVTLDDAGSLLTSTDPNGKTTYGRDSSDTFITSVTPPMPSSGVSLTWSTGYDASTGIVTSTTDPNGQTTSYGSFDSLNRSQTITYPQPDGGHAYFTYSPTQLITQHDIDGGSSRVQRYTQYDEYGRISRVADENGQSSYDWYQTDYCYDTSGRLSFQPVRYQGGGWASAKRCSGAGDTTTYDSLGRITKVSHADGSYAQYSYRGRATQVTDENGVSRIMQSDGLGRLTTVCEISASGMGAPVDNPVPCTNSAGAGLDIAGTGFLTQYSYSLANHTSTITQGAQPRATQTDSLGRLISLQQPEVGGAAEPTTFSYSYNSTGLQVVRKRLKANSGSPTALTTTTTQYDELGRILSVAYDDGTPTKAYSYDDANYLNAPQVHRTNVKGRPSTAMTYVPNTSNMITGVQYSYDIAGRVTSMWECGAAATCGNGALARELTFSYDYAGRQTGVSDPIAGNIVYGLTTAGEITAITNTTYNNSTNPGALVSAVQNGPYGPASYHLGNGLTNVMTYDSSGRSEFRWLCAGGVTATFCSGGTQLYGIYTQWKGDYLTHSIDTTENTGGDYAYDALGHLTAYTGTQGQPTSYSWAYDRYGNRYGATPGANITINKGNNIIQTAGFYNDAAGNETNDSVHSYTFDAENNVISVDGGSTATYTYNALNQRMGITNAQGSREYTYDFAGRRIGTWTPGTNTGTQGQIWWGNSPIAYRDNDNSVYFQQADWVGTQRILTNYAGSVASQYTSRPWGEAYATTGKDDNIFHYAGLEQSENTGTLHAQFRDYDSSLGRWLSPDSYTGSYDFTNPQSFNRFSYAGNSPISATDPTGQFWEGDLGAGGVALVCQICGAIAEGANLFEHLGDWLGWWGGPTFHGSVTPRPEATGTGEPDWDTANGDFGEHLGLPKYGPRLPNLGIAGALGLPDNGCEFGACGGGGIGFGIGATTAPAPLGWCGVDPSACVTGLWALLRSIPVAAAATVTLSMTGDSRGCIPAAGTQCHEEQTGHTHNGWDPHYHIWTQNQNPSTGQCFWNRGAGTKGTTQFPPSGMNPCSSYPTWPWN